MIKSEFIVSPCKWRNRYVKYGIDGLKDVSKRLHDIKTKVTKEIEEIFLDLRLKAFGTNSRMKAGTVICAAGRDNPLATLFLPLGGMPISPPPDIPIEIVPTPLSTACPIFHTVFVPLTSVAAPLRSLSIPLSPDTIGLCVGPVTM